MWQQPTSKKLTLIEQEVHIWRADLEQSTREIEAFSQILSSDEQIRANRFRFEHHRRRFIVARGILRQLISCYLEIEPDLADLFRYSDRSKPRLADNLNSNNLQFNLAHSHELALYTFTLNHRIGIDLEFCKSHQNIEQIARRFFSLQEANYISSLTGIVQQQAFLQIWTAKEAYLKATGEGLSGSLEQVEISIARSGIITLNQIPLQNSDIANWQLHRLNPHPEYLATLAVEANQQQHISLWNV